MTLTGVGEFVSATWDMINAGFKDCGWSPDGREIVVYNPERLAEDVGPHLGGHEVVERVGLQGGQGAASVAVASRARDQRREDARADDERAQLV